MKGFRIKEDHLAKELHRKHWIYVICLVHI
jgi:hypothetical protein